MVALKHLVWGAGSLRSQEKQERRGGIETSIPFRGSAAGRSGSRNAVVALKPVTRDLGNHAPFRSRNAVVALKLARPCSCFIYTSRKQERRGGIETSSGLSVSIFGSREAGTPWWH